MICNCTIHIYIYTCMNAYKSLLLITLVRALNINQCKHQRTSQRITMRTKHSKITINKKEVNRLILKSIFQSVLAEVI
jgi:hypothetical protein